MGFKKRAFSASSFDLIALGAGIVNGELAVCVDARRERIYTAIYRFRGGKAKKTLQDSLLSFDELMKRIDSDMIFSGDALLTYGDALRKRLGKNAVFLNPSFWFPRAGSLIHLRNEYPQWLRSVSLRAMTPIYLRNSEAEEKYAGKRRKHS